jgi:4-hydroxy-tetrahydrodipicolinate reductase
MKVVISGITGKMGSTLLQTLLAKSSEYEVVAGIAQETGEIEGIKIYHNLDEIASDFDVLVDFTRKDPAFGFIQKALEKKKKVVSGTTGFTEDELKKLETLTLQNMTSLLIAPNFSIGAVLMMEFSRLAAKYFSGVEIVELHHDQKLDAPSGTSKLTREKIKSVQNKWDIPIHSVRLPGLVAHQEVIFGNKGEIFTLRHDSMNRDSFMNGVLQAIQFVKDRTGYFYGFDKVLGF